jgi:magnesium transporter
MSVSSYYLDETGAVQTNLSPSRMSEALHSGKGLLWVDISETAENDGALLADVFQFHRLAIEDCVESQIHPPKIDDYDDYLFIVVHGINHAAEAVEAVETAELELFLGANYVVSNHNFPLYSVAELRRLVEMSPRPLQRGADFFAYLLIDALVDNVLPTLDLMIDVAEDVEEQALTTSHPATLQSIQRLKRSVRRVHRTMVPQRELLNRLSRGEFSLIRQQTRVFYRDVYDHLVLIEDLNMDIRESADNAITTYLSAIANRQNETMKVLAVVGAIFLPLTLLAGVYGMNFDYMPELRWHYAYFVVIGFMLLVIAGALVLFWRRGWFRPRPLPVQILRPFAVEKDKLRGHASREGESMSRPEE